ncbi:MAG: hypothetical protein ACKOI0_00195, partial [Actinomycetota bacterium]
MAGRGTGRRNRVFWIYLGVLTVGGLLLGGLIVLNRPLLREGSMREVQENLSAVARPGRGGGGRGP